MTTLLVIVDLEATCWPASEREQAVEIMEVIEIGAVKVDQNGQQIDEFTTFVRPKENRRLSDFCQSLTGISQADVDTAPDYPEAISIFDHWLGDIGGWAWASWGRYDLRQLLSEKTRHGVKPSLLSIPHINLKRPRRKSTRSRKQGLQAALNFHDLKFVGNPHRGLDDAKNIAHLLPYIKPELLQHELEMWEPTLWGRPSKNPLQ